MYRTIIVDDESHALDTLNFYIKKTPYLVSGGAYENPLDALPELNGPQPPQIAFLDIDMPELSGLALAELVKKETKVIFTSAHRQYALDAFGVDAAGFLLKPFSYEDFLKTVQKVCSHIQENDQNITEKPIFFSGNAKGKYIKIHSEQIIHIEAMLNYIKIYTTNSPKAEIIYLTLKEVEDEILGVRLVRVHRSFVINLTHLERIEGNQLVMSNGKVITIGNTYKEYFFNYLKGHTVRTKQKGLNK